MKKFLRVTWRATLSTSALALVLALTGCGGGGGGGGSSPPPPTSTNQAPTPKDDIVSVSGAGVSSINVLGNDTDPNNDPLTVSSVGTPTVGTASVNSNGTIALAGLPSGFRGLTRFTYTVRDPGGLTATANAAVFVDTTAFRVVYAGDGGTSGAEDLYLANFAAAPVKLGNATEGALRLTSFTPAKSGATVAYTRADPANVATTEEFWYVRAASPTAPVRITLPAGTRLVSRSYVAVSPDGRWIAYVVGPGGNDPTKTLYLLDVTSSAGATAVRTDAIAEAPEFTPDSRGLLFVARPNATTGSTLYRAPVDQPTSPVRLSAAGVPNTAGVRGFLQTPDGSRIVVARTEGTSSFAVIDAATPGTERTISHVPAAGQAIYGDGGFLSGDGQLLAYSTYPSASTAPLRDINATYVANLSGTPGPRAVATANANEAIAVYAFRPDNAAVLFARVASSGGRRLYEAPVDGSGTQTLVTDLGIPNATGLKADYDGTSDRVVYEQAGTDPNVPPNQQIEERVIGRSQFGGAGTKLGTAGQIALVASFSAASRGVLVLGERVASSSLPVPALVNTSAPDKPYAFATGNFNTTLPVAPLRVQMVDAP